MVVIVALAALVVLFACPAVGPLVVVLAVNLALWARRRAMLLEERARAEARAEIRREREAIIAWKSIP